MKKQLMAIALGGLLGFTLSHVQAEEGAELTRSLDGLTMTYVFDNGQSYRVQFDEAQLRYQFVSGKRPERWWGPYPYQARETAEGNYFAAWFEEDYYATLLFDRNSETIYGSSVSGQRSWFEKGRITLQESGS